jgi:hypothetical protein
MPDQAEMSVVRQGRLRISTTGMTKQVNESDPSICISGISGWICSRIVYWKTGMIKAL